MITLRSKAPATVKKYAGGFSRWKKWADSKPCTDSFPVRPFQLALYLAFLTQSAKTSAPIKEAVHSLSWAHQLAVVKDPTDHWLVKQVLAGSKHILAHKTTKKEPIMPEILNKMFDKFVMPASQLPIVCTMSICLLGYAGFLQFSELASLRECDISFYDEHMKVFIESSKTDQFRGA